MLCSVVTPSFRQLAWLKRCVRSVADQEAPHEHIVQDAGTGPELEEWVGSQGTATLHVEKDAGMYDALNRGFGRARGEILSYLNCDEQYLPGTLAAVSALFARRPELDLIACDHLIVDGEGKLLSYHRATPPRRAMILTDHLYDYTCGLFFRRRLWEQAGSFDTEFRVVGDAEWVSRALATGARTACLNRYAAAFSLTGNNLSLGERATVEQARLLAANPRWMRLAARGLREFRHVEKLLRGGYTSGAISYEIYATEEATARHRFTSERPSSRHPFTLG